MDLAASLQALEDKRKQLWAQLEALGDFRRGGISVNYRKCGKANCHCARPGHPGHGDGDIRRIFASHELCQGDPRGIRKKKLRSTPRAWFQESRICQGNPGGGRSDPYSYRRV